MNRVDVAHGRVRLEGLRLARCERNREHGWWTMVLNDEEDASEHRIRITEHTTVLDRKRKPSDLPVGDGDLLNVLVQTAHPDVAEAVQIVERGQAQ